MTHTHTHTKKAPTTTPTPQVGFKRMLYMSLHAESVISLVEKPCREIQFKQVSGDFDLLRGKWMLQEDDAQVGRGGVLGFWGGVRWMMHR